MRWVFVGLIAMHGLIHFMGFIKAFGLGELSQLTQPIPRPLGVAWLGAGLLTLAAAGALAAGSRRWWVVGFAAVLVSQAVVISAWSDAKFATIANVLLLAGAAYGFASDGP